LKMRYADTPEFKALIAALQGAVAGDEAIVLQSTRDPLPMLLLLYACQTEAYGLLMATIF
jgi:hypothetical protein